MKKYWQILKGYRASPLVCPPLVLVSVMCEAIRPMYITETIDSGVMQRDLSVIAAVGREMTLVSIVGLVFSIANVYVSSRASIDFETDLCTKLFGKVQQLFFFDIDRFDAAPLIIRLISDISYVQQVIQVSMYLMPRSPLMLAMTVFFVVRISPELTGVLLAAIPVLGFNVFFTPWKGFPFFLKVQQKVDQLNEVVCENLTNIRMVRSLVQEDFEAHKFKGKSESLRDTVIHASNIIVAILPMMQLVMNLSIIATPWMGEQEVMAGGSKVGELISLINYPAQVLMSLMMLSMIIMTYARASASSKRILEVLDTQPSLTDTPEGMRSIRQIEKGETRFEKVNLRYDESGTDALWNTNFHVRSGETVAVAGTTGLARSSLVQLIPRLYDISSGETWIGDIPIQNYNLYGLHTRTGMMLQKNELFTGTIVENLRQGEPDATQGELEKVAHAAEAHEFIRSLPAGYDTQSRRGGVNLSGGQKQRICIARAPLHRPKILVLDDSTSTVDPETELRIRNSLNAWLHDTMMLITAQHIYAMQSANRIILLDDGEVESIGTPGELLERSEMYREIYHPQQIII